MKLAVIGGAGLLGSTTAFYAGTQDLFAEIKLVDVNPNLVKGHAMDLSQALPPASSTKVSVGEYPDLEDCQVILLAASKPDRQVSSREEFIRENLSIIDAVCSGVGKHCKDAIFLTATNPVDLFNYMIWKKLNFPREHMLGFCANDELRFLLAVSQVTGIPFQALEGFCIGEHVDDLIYLWQTLKADGRPLALTQAQREQVRELCAGFLPAYQALHCGRTAGWTSAVMITRMLRAIVRDTGELIPCSVIPDGEYGLSGLSIGLPVSLGRDGVRCICEAQLDSAQQEHLARISQHQRQLFAACG